MGKGEICSGCNKPKPTVHRQMFDGLCADCTDKALYDYDFAKQAKKRNEELINDISYFKV
tara:strand:- start:16 stop:195 length:180 start_codon:yes stop_codon:yes gene_type:complete